MTLVDPELHYGQISTTQKPFPRKNVHNRTLYNTWSLFLGAQSSCVVLWVVLGLVRCLRWNMGTELGRSQLHVTSVGGFSRFRTVGTSLLSRLDGQVWFSWSDSPRDQAVSKSVEEVMEDCTESHQIWNDAPGEQSWNQVGTTVPAAMGPSAPSEPVLHSSGFAVTREHAVTSGCFENRADCAASHGFDTSPAHLAWSQPLVGTQSAQIGHLGVEPMSVISGFHAESSTVVQGKSCVVRAVPHGSDVDRSGGSSGKHTSPARLARSQPDVGTQHANVGYPGVDFSMASKPVFLSSGLAVSNEHAVEVVDPDFHAESSAVVQGKSCVERAVSHGFDVALSGGSCGKDTSLAHHASSQPGVDTQFAHVGYPRVDFAVEAVVPGFPAESSAVSHGVDVAMSGGSCGKGTSPTYLARSQHGVSTQ